MVSTTGWQADASLWKEDTFFDAGTFCLPSVFPQASLEAYTVRYDLETGIHDVFLTMKGILRLSTLSTSSQSSHVAEFSNGIMKAVPRRGNSGVSSHITPGSHTNSNERAAVDLQEVDPAILSVHCSGNMEMDENPRIEGTTMLIDDSITATGGILRSFKEQPLKSHEHFGASTPSDIFHTLSCSSAEFPADGVDDGVEDCEPRSSSTCEEISSYQLSTSSPARLEPDAPNGAHQEADSSSTMISNTGSIEEQIANSDNLGAVHSPEKCPEKANSLNVLTDLVLEDDISFSTSSASESSSDNGTKTQSKPATSATSPTFSLPLDLLDIHAPQRKTSKTIFALDLEEKPSISEHRISLQWLDLATSDGQYYIWEKLQEAEEPVYAQEDQTVDMFPRLSSPKELEGPLRLEDLDLDIMFGQSATDLDGEGLPQEAIVPDDEGVAENDIARVGTMNDYQPNGPEFHHLNLLRYPVYQASRTPSALSLWVAMASKKRVQIEDRVSLKAVVSSQAAKWVDPVLLDEGVSVPEEVKQHGNATAYRNSLIGLTTIQYEPCGTWQSEVYGPEQETPYVVDSDSKEILDEAYYESYGYPGLQQPYSMKEHDNFGYSFPSPQMKQQKGWESLERYGNSNLRCVLDEDSITRWHAPAATSTSYEVAGPTDLQEDKNNYVEDSLVFPAVGPEFEDRHGPWEADEVSQVSSSLRSLLAFSSVAHEFAMSPPNEGRSFTPRIREDSEEVDDLSHSLDDESWETDENGAFVSPKKGKERLRGEMSEDLPSGTPRADGDLLGLSEVSSYQLTSPEAQGDIAPAFTICHYEAVDLAPTGIFWLPETELGTMIPLDRPIGGVSALPMPLEESSTQEDVLQAELSLPYCKYNDVSEIPLRRNLAATVGQAGREAGRWLTENILW